MARFITASESRPPKSGICGRGCMPIGRTTRSNRWPAAGESLRRPNRGWRIRSIIRSRRCVEPDAAARPDQLRQRLIEVEEVTEEFAADLLDRADGKLDQVTAKLVAQAASDGNQLAIEVLNHACQVLGWAIAQVITLLSPDVVVIGGGVSQIGESLLFAPLRAEVERYVFPPLLRSYEILPAALGEQVVLHGALALAAGAEEKGC